jgi:hypothetical protein
MPTHRFGATGIQLRRCVCAPKALVQTRRSTDEIQSGSAEAEGQSPFRFEVATKIAACRILQALIGLQSDPGREGRRQAPGEGKRLSMISDTEPWIDLAPVCLRNLSKIAQVR